MPTLRLARQAMATRFEVLLHGPDAGALHAAGEAALEEVARLEAQLSLYRAGSEVAQINARAAGEAVRVSPEVFGLLQRAQSLSAETGGAFDFTVGPLMRCWGFMDGGGRRPAPTELAAVRARVGWEKIQLDPATRTVRLARDGVMLDLGAIGKGFAVERAAEVLREAGVTSGLIHGGTSTVVALGRPPDAEAWKIVVDVAAELKRRVPSQPVPEAGAVEAAPESGVPPVFTVSLRDESISVSAPSGRQFEHAGKVYGHVLDPRTGEPAAAALLASVVTPSATESDALSTALLVLGRDGPARLAELRTGLRTLLVWNEGGHLLSEARGFSSNLTG